MNDMDKLKYELARLVESTDYKTVNTLFRRNPNTWKFNTREINENNIVFVWKMCEFNYIEHSV